MIKTWMELQIPIAKINPNLDEIGNYYIQLLNNILDTHKYIIMWGQRGSTGTGEIFGNVEKKKIKKYFSLEQICGRIFRNELQELLQDSVRTQRNSSHVHGTTGGHVSN